MLFSNVPEWYHVCLSSLKFLNDENVFLFESEIME